MTPDPDDWPAATWRLIAAAPPGLPTLHATLDAARAVCDRAMPDGARTPDFDPATGWAYLDGVLAGLELATDLAPEVADPWPPTIDRATAQQLLDQLLRHAADVCLVLAQDLRADGATTDLLALAGVARQLPDTYRAAFGQPW